MFLTLLEKLLSMVNKRENVSRAIRNFTIEHLSFQSSTKKLAIKNFEKGNSQILLIETFFFFSFLIIFFSFVVISKVTLTDCLQATGVYIIIPL